MAVILRGNRNIDQRGGIAEGIEPQQNPVDRRDEVLKIRHTVRYEL
jgi:hypothetical protein